MKKILCLLMCIFLISGAFFPKQSVQAKTSKMKFSKSTVSVAVGKSTVIKTKKSYKKLKITPSKKGIVRVSSKGKKITVKGLKSGSLKLTVKGYNKKGKLVAKGTIKVTSISLNILDASAETAKFDAGEYSISKVHSGEGTFYDRTSTGAANLDDYEDIYLTAAMNNEDYMNGLAGAYIEITDKDGDKVNVMITDRLPEGKKGDIDLSRKAFKTIEPEITGRMNITWKIIPLPTDEPVSFLWKPTSTQYWAEVQVRNGRYPIKSLEYYNTSSKSYEKLERKEYNYFAAPNGLGNGPYKFRITDFYGHVIIEDGININTNSTPVKGSANFPY